MDSTKPKQPQGNFAMNLNFRRTGNENAPPITGRVSTPEDPETQFSFSAFQHTDEKGEVYWIGPVDMGRSMRHALNNTPEQGTHFIAIRENGFKVFKELRDGTPNPAYAALSAEQKEKEDSKPAYWGTWTRTPNEPQLRVSAWDREPTRYGPWASGNTQHPLTKEQAAALARGEAPAEILTQPEPEAPPAQRRRREAAGRDANPNRAD